MTRYIITFHDHSISPEQAQEAFSAEGVLRMPIDEIDRSAQTQFPTLSEHFLFLEHLGMAIADLEESEAASLENSVAISFVEKDIETHVLGTLDAKPIRVRNTAPLWNMTMIRANSAWAIGKFGDGIRVAVIDTGIASHPNLQVYGGISYVSGDSSYRDNHGHGTHCAGIIAAKGRNNVYGVAFGSHLFAVKALADNGSGMVSWVIQGMNWCISQSIDVISMSLGSTSAPISGYIDAVKRCEDRNITVVCASGNSFNSSFPWVNAPANSLTNTGGLSSFPISVASVDSTRQIAASSSRGTNSANWNPVTVSAPGVSIFSTHLNANYATMSGTSMACPHVSGIVALIKEGNPGLSPTAIKTLLAMTSQTLGSSPFPNAPFGYGLIDCVKALGIIEDKRIPSSSLDEAS